MMNEIGEKFRDRTRPLGKKLRILTFTSFPKCGKNVHLHCHKNPSGGGKKDQWKLRCSFSNKAKNCANVPCLRGVEGNSKSSRNESEKHCIVHYYTFFFAHLVPICAYVVCVCVVLNIQSIDSKEGLSSADFDLTSSHNRTWSFYISEVR